MGGGSGDTGAAMRQQEMQQQQQVNRGLTQLGQVFGGGYGVGQVTGGHPGGKYYNKATSYKKGGQYFDVSGNPFTGTPQQAQQLIKQGALFMGRGQSDAFGTDWLNERRQAYLNYALPQVSTQAQNQWQQLAYRLGNQGILKSGAAGRLGSSLNTEIGNQKQAVASQAEDLVQQNKQSVEQQRSNLTSQLLAGASPATTTQQALASAASVRSPNVFAPLGNLFSNWSNMYLANQAATTPTTPSLYSTVASRVPSLSTPGSSSSYNIVK